MGCKDEDNFIRRLRIYKWFWSKAWWRAFNLRQQIKVNSEAVHLVIAAMVGVIILSKKFSNTGPEES